MNLHEYQAKELMRTYGLPVLDGYLAYTPGEAEAAADRLGGGLCVVKAQVHAGGRGKGGGVKLATSAAEAREIAEQIIGMQLVTPQTSAKGKLVRKIYVEAGCDIASEFYLSLLVDRENRCISVIASTEGGMEIEEVAHETPDKIIKLKIDPSVGVQSFQGLQLGTSLGLDTAATRKCNELLHDLYEMFIESDLSLLEINPLVFTAEGEFVILDAKCTVDSNALYRQPELKGMEDYDEQDARDLAAGKLGLAYVAMEGNIGCMVNGAGLAMATMDIIKSYGEEPANFLDVGGGADKDKVCAAFKIILQDERVAGILVNIFGGILRCEVLANGVVEAARELEVKVPLVVRLCGTNVDEGKKILSESGLKITPADTMDEAASKIVAAIK